MSRLGERIVPLEPSKIKILKKHRFEYFPELPQPIVIAWGSREQPYTLREAKVLHKFLGEVLNANLTTPNHGNDRRIEDG